MLESQALRRSSILVRLRLGDHLIRMVSDSELAMVQSAVALLRTIYEDHFVDPEHNSCLFFHGCMLAGSQARTHDFSVTHRSERVLLSDFTFLHNGPEMVSLSLASYASQVLRFGVQVSCAAPRGQSRPEWQDRYLQTQRDYLRQLLALTDRFVAGGCQNYQEYCAQFRELHGQLKRPLEMQILRVVQSGAPRRPIQVLAKITFGPLCAQEKLPMRLSLGDVILVTVNDFTNEGISLTLEGVGSGGVRPGDRLFGLQLFYP